MEGTARSKGSGGSFSPFAAELIRSSWSRLNLSFPRPCGWSAGSSRCRHRISIALRVAIRKRRLDRVHGGDLEPSHVDGGLCGSIPPLASTGATLPIGDNVEGYEENKVGAQDDAARDGGELFPGAAAIIGHPGPVGGSKVGVGCKVDEN